MPYADDIFLNDLTRFYVITATFLMITFEQELILHWNFENLSKIL